jgi:glutaredoxin
VKFISCDRSDEERSICKKSGITKTPLMVIGGMAHFGYLSPEDLGVAVRVPAYIAEQLGNSGEYSLSAFHLKMCPLCITPPPPLAGATMYGRETCIWTKRQKALFGAHFDPNIPYVVCDRDMESQRKCREAGVTGVPAWKIDGKLHPGFHTLPQLVQLARVPGIQERE